MALHKAQFSRNGGVLNKSHCSTPTKMAGRSREKIR